jgi:hypothetical protein
LPGQARWRDSRVATGKVAFDTMLFTIAMLRALPPSYDPLVQSLYQQKNLTPEVIFTYVQTEHNRFLYCLTASVEDVSPALIRRLCSV